MFCPALKLLDWYDHNYRQFPWRANPGKLQDPYIVWLSEIMLQQTTTTTVQPYFKKFLQKWPTLQAFAHADLDDILKLWQGLGYYTRARNLYKCAQVLVSEYNGHFPRTVEELIKLPGIGPYTAAAIATIAFGKPATAVDGNIIRVFSRLKTIDAPMPKNKAKIEALASHYVPENRPGDYTQALMDLGATICTSKNPTCSLCPWQTSCQAFNAGNVQQFPVREFKKPLAEKFTVAFIIENSKGQILFRKRPNKGLLAGLYEVPNLAWSKQEYDIEDAINKAPFSTNWTFSGKIVKHTFTHLHLYTKVLKARGPNTLKGTWCHPDNFSELALPTLIKKILTA